MASLQTLISHYSVVEYGQQDYALPVLGWNDFKGVLLSWDGTTPKESFCLGMERLQGSPSVLGWNDSRGLVLSWDGTTPGESVLVERHQGYQSWWNDTRGVILSCDETTPVESFCPGIERLQGSNSVLVKRLQRSPSVLGLKDPMGDILSWDGTTPGESFCPGIERLQGSHSVLVKRLQGSPSVLG